MLLTRLILGTVFVVALVGLCWLDYHASRPGLYLLPLAVIVGLLGAGELLAMWRRRGDGAQPQPWAVYAGTLLTILAAGAPVWLPDHWQSAAAVGPAGCVAVGLATSFLLALISQMGRYEQPGPATTSLALTCLAVLYVGGLTSFLVLLRMLGVHSPADHARTGMLALASLIATVKLSDIGQYTAGRLFGAHKLAPKISPGKTWEGVLGGMLFALAGGGVTYWLAGTMAPQANLRFDLGLIVYSLALAAMGIVGDLGESMLKRDAGVKDSSTWLPGFGGVLDLLDSLLGAAPVAYLFWAFLWRP